MKCARPVDFPTLYGALNIAYYDHNLAFEELKKKTPLTFKIAICINYLLKYLRLKQNEFINSQ